VGLTTTQGAKREQLAVTRFAVIGDLHIGRPGSLSYAGTVDDVRAALDALVASGIETIVLNGDVLDLERGRIPLATAREWQTMRRLHPGLEQELQRREVFVVAGNHDEDLLRSGLARESVDVVAGGYRVRVEHGHRFDAPIKQLRRFASLATWASGRVVDSPLRGVYDSMRRAEGILTGDGRACAHPDRLPDGLERRAMRWLLRTPTYDGLIIGHTHRSGCWTVGPCWLLNPGDSPGPALQAAIVDLDERSIQWAKVGSDGVDAQELRPLPAPR
jgi:predicted phosphodiesterase